MFIILFILCFIYSGFSLFVCPINRQSTYTRWISGSAFINSDAIFGTQGVPSITTVPGPYYDPIFFDYNNLLMLFGGYYYSYTIIEGGVDVYSTNLFSFNTTTNMWTWLWGYGNDTVETLVSNKGVEEDTNVIGGRLKSGYLRDGDYLYILGGLEKTFWSSTYLFKFNLLNYKITWLSGESVASPVYGTKNVYASGNKIPHYEMPFIVKMTDYGINSLIIFGIDESFSLQKGLTVWEFDLSTLYWRWIKGSGGSVIPRDLGTFRIESSNVEPGSYLRRSTFFRLNYWVYLFGGVVDLDGNFIRENKVFSFNLLTSNWAWISGNETLSSQMHYTNKFELSDENKISPRLDASGFVYKNHLFIYGGYDADYSFNDMWEFNPNNYQWAWMYGNTTYSTYELLLYNPLMSAEIRGPLLASSTEYVLGSRYGQKVVPLNGKFYVFGGTEESQGDNLNDLWEIYPYCNFSYCFDKLETDPTVCSGQGSCIGGNSDNNLEGYCVCNSGVEGDNCEYDMRYSCFGLNNRDERICGGRHGSCVGTDNCSCITGWSGSECSIKLLPTPYKTLRNESNWVWEGGNNITDIFPYYGEIGVECDLCDCGSRKYASVVMSNDNLYIYGAQYNVRCYFVPNPLYLDKYYADMWKFNTTSKKFTYLYGQKVPNATEYWYDPNPPIYGIKGVESPTNKILVEIPTMFSVSNYIYLITPDIEDIWRYNTATNLFAWIYGNHGGATVPVYGTKNIESESNFWGTYYGYSTRIEGVVIRDSIYTVCGTRYDPVYTAVVRDEIWRYNTTTNMFTWLYGGGTNVNGMPIYGTKGVESSTNELGTRGAVLLAAYGDYIYIYGGGGYFHSFQYQDLWRFSLITRNVTWIGGNSTYIIGNKWYNWRVCSDIGEYWIESSDNLLGSRYYASMDFVMDSLFIFFGAGSSDMYPNPIINGNTDPIYPYSPPPYCAGTRTNDIWRYNLETQNFTLLYGNVDYRTEQSPQTSIKHVFGVKNIPSRTNVFGKVLIGNLVFRASDGYYVLTNTIPEVAGYAAIIWRYETLYSSCFGIYGSDPTVCSSHGVCHEYNCYCQNCWEGSMCDTPSQICNNNCFNYPNPIGNYCNGHGSCTGKIEEITPCNCTPNTGFIGNNCSTDIRIWCNGKSNYDPTVCNSRGTCTSTNYCLCNEPTNFTGSDCQIDLRPRCGGYLYFDPLTCNTHGRCVGMNNCSCETGFSGTNCQNDGRLRCNGVLATDPNVCYGRGTCVSTDLCNCSIVGIIGNNCQYDVRKFCWGVISSDPTTCSGHGTCQSTDHCVCQTFYSGYNCQLYGNRVCYSVSELDPLVCNGHGTCILNDTCLCNKYYIGSLCNGYEVHSCNGILANNDAVCDYHGSCVKNGETTNCYCDSGYKLLNGHCVKLTCNGIDYDDPNVCSKNGECTNEQCICNSGWYGLDCEKFTCDNKLPSDPAVCNSNGICITANTCQCNDEWYGALCNSQIEIPSPQYFCKNTQGSWTLFTEEGACGEHGSCVGNDHCLCDCKYEGEICETEIENFDRIKYCLKTNSISYNFYSTMEISEWN